MKALARKTGTGTTCCKELCNWASALGVSLKHDRSKDISERSRAVGGGIHSKISAGDREVLG